MSKLILGLFISAGVVFNALVLIEIGKRKKWRQK